VVVFIKSGSQMKNFKKLAILVSMALALSACGGGDDDVINETVTIPENTYTDIKFTGAPSGDGRYDVEVSSNNYGVIIEFSRIEDCSNLVVAVKTYAKTCRIKNDAIIRLINPAGPGAGGNEVVAIKVKKN
jgi:hypothetical protein